MAHNFSENEEMLRSFRCQDLANLLTYAGQSKNGKKSELLDRCLNILKKGNPNIIIKIREIYAHKQATSTVNSYSSLITAVNSNSNSSSNSPDPGSSMMNGRYQPTAPYTGYSQFAPNQGINLQVPGFSSSMLGHHNTRSMPNSGYNQPRIQVKFEKLAFYEFLHELQPPSKLQPTNSRPHAYNFNFFMSTDQANEITGTREIINGKAEFSKQIHLRFGYYEPSAQADNLPANLLVNVNGKPAMLPAPKPTSKPNADIIRPGRSIDVTSQCRLAPNMPNKVDITWLNPDQSKLYCVGVFVFRKVSVEYLLKNLKTKTLAAEVTRQMVREKLQITDSDFEIETNELKVSLMCPLMKFRMNLPGRATTCKHVQCFDLESYLMMNEKKPVWNCPVCDQNAPYDNLIIDTLNQEIISQCGNCEEVVFSKDGTWTKVEEAAKGSESKKFDSNIDESCVELICDDDSPEKGPAPIDNQENAAGPKPTMCVIDLTVDSSSDEDEPAGTVSQVTQKIDQIKTDMDCVSQNSGAAKNQEQLNNKKSTKVISDSENSTPDLMRHTTPTKSNTNNKNNEEASSAEKPSASPSESIISISSSNSSRSNTPVPETQPDNPPQATAIPKQPVKPQIIQPSKFQTPEKQQKTSTSTNGKQQTTPTNTNLNNSSSRPSSTNSSVASPMDLSSLPPAKTPQQQNPLQKSISAATGLSNSQLARGISMGTNSSSSSSAAPDNISSPNRNSSKAGYLNSFSSTQRNPPTESASLNHAQMQSHYSPSTSQAQQKSRSLSQSHNTSTPSRESIERQNRIREQQQKLLATQQLSRNILQQPQQQQQPQQPNRSSSHNQQQRAQPSHINGGQARPSMEKPPIPSRHSPSSSSSGIPQQQHRSTEHLMVGTGISKLPKRTDISMNMRREKAMMTLDDELKTMASNPNQFSINRNRMAPTHNSHTSLKARHPQQPQNVNYNLKEKCGLKRPSCDRDLGIRNPQHKKQNFGSEHLPESLQRDRISSASSNPNHQLGHSNNPHLERNVSKERVVERVPRSLSNSQYPMNHENNNNPQLSNQQISPNNQNRSNSRSSAQHSPISPGNSYNNLQQSRQVFINSPGHHPTAYNSGIPSQYQYHMQQHSHMNSQPQNQRQQQIVRPQNLHNS